jgi:hypothetical protein
MACRACKKEGEYVEGRGGAIQPPSQDRSWRDKIYTDIERKDVREIRDGVLERSGPIESNRVAAEKTGQVLVRTSAAPGRAESPVISGEEGGYVRSSEVIPVKR